ncbi:MAG: hypothetical protein ACI8XU_002758, partial [Kiritimatiellia bacterium]
LGQDFQGDHRSYKLSLSWGYLEYNERGFNHE